MQTVIIYLFKIFKLFWLYLNIPIDYLLSHIIFYLNGVKYSTFKNYGLPRVNVGLGGTLIIGSNFRSNNREMSNPIGRFNRCSIIVGQKATLKIGNNVGLSSTAIVCHNSIEIGDNVKIGGNVVIYDTDFHSLNPNDRLNKQNDKLFTKSSPICIGKNVFIGAHSTILKGVTIGDNSIIGACSVVTKSIPPNEIWAGNQCKFIRCVD